MKRIPGFISIHILIILMFISCKKDDPQPTPGGGGPAPPVMTAMVDGEKWEAFSNNTKVTISDSTFMTGMTNDASVINIIINDQIITTGTYTFSGWAGHTAEFKSNVNSTDFWSTNHSMTSGTLEVTHVSTSSNRISGTFSFKAYNPADNSYIEITDGKLSNVSIQIINSPPPVPCFFYFKVNGVAFNSTFFMTDFTIPGDLIISAVNWIGNGITLTIPSSISIGTHTLGPLGSGQPYGAFAYSLTNVAESVSGTLVITKKNFITDEFAGTFEFTAKDPSTNLTFNITDGCFNFD
jgi:hypothetical protein